ncbi:hypothetical protein [Candidatus Nitrotoga sp. AM1P]|nr:hypothetical protein [Candidatus Nitrotoga sp. AM1P]
MIMVVAMRNGVINVSKMCEKVMSRGGYVTYPVDGATLSRLVELY